jgi:predicted O-methyltransferase YrrM
MIELWERNGHEVTDAEGGALARLARAVPEGQLIIEVGSYRGRSTCFLAAGSAQGGRADVYAVDLWTAAPEMQADRKGKLKRRPYRSAEARQAFDEAVRRYGHGLVHAIQGASIEVAETFGPGVAGLVFIDASHAAADVAADCRAWAPTIASGGIIAFHDWDFPGVRAGVDAGLDHGEWRHIATAERIHVLQRAD